MDAQLCRALNLMSLEQLAAYLEKDIDRIKQYYQELLDDSSFLNEINEQIRRVRPLFNKGIFKHEKLDSADWFAMQRILLYVLIRIFRPKRCLETGVFYGGNSSFMLHALRKNQEGELISIDLPGNALDQNTRHHLVGRSEDVPMGLDSGFIVPESLKKRWTLIRGDSLQEIPKLHGQFDLYIHDSDHAYSFLKHEMSLVWPKLSAQAVVLADDLDWSNGFFSFCDEKHLFPLIITDNGKSGLRARTGVVYLGHRFRARQDVVGVSKNEKREMANV